MYMVYWDTYQLWTSHTYRPNLSLLVLVTGRDQCQHSQHRHT